LQHPFRISETARGVEMTASNMSAEQAYPFDMFRRREFGRAAAAPQTDDLRKKRAGRPNLVAVR
jgi:hypothetical protein